MAIAKPAAKGQGRARRHRHVYATELRDDMQKGTV
jgi:hypothetical protein